MIKLKNLIWTFLLIILFSCTNDDLEKIHLDHESDSNVLNRIVGLGFSESDIVEYDDYYLVEGDIVFLKSDTISSSTQLKQARTYNIVTNSLIKVYLDLNFSTLNSIMSSALDEAISSYNAVGSNLTFVRTTDQNKANIIISRDNNLGAGVCGRGGFPFVDGRPYNSVLISETTLVTYDLASYDQLVFLLVHEMGHNIGLRHTNWSELGESAGSTGAIQIPGTPSNDANSVMTGYSCGFAWNGFSGFDRIALLTMYPRTGAYGGADAHPLSADFDGDAISDVCLKLDDGCWLIDYATNGFGSWDWTGHQYVGTNTHPLSADFDGDGKSDISIKVDDGRWLIDYASNGFGAWDWTGYQYGNTDTHPLSADYDGDGKSDISVKVDDGRWLIDYASNGFTGWDWAASQYGNADAHPLSADFDGDGKSDICIKVNDGRWLINYASNGFGAWDWARYYQYVGTDSYPLSADFDGDGKSDISIKLDDGRWLIDYASNGFAGWDWTGSQYGNAEVHPLSADFDGDGKSDICVKVDDGRWLIDYASNGFAGWDASL
nr:M57 family metalloprotease [uncultured Draconibacterium sp.]